MQQAAHHGQVLGMVVDDHHLRSFARFHGHAPPIQRKP
jgi:hypothetical protein